MHSGCAHHRILHRPLLEIFQSALHLLPSQQQQQCTNNSCDKDLDRRRLFNDPMRHFLGDLAGVSGECYGGVPFKASLLYSSNPLHCRAVRGGGIKGQRRAQAPASILKNKHKPLVVALIFERDYGRWMLSFNIDLLAVAFNICSLPHRHRQWAVQACLENWSGRLCP
ncbi:hypothetical protein QJS10_CPB13g01394 [Acorus calamus]|uniref:Uncharacterized protein n=1 Tax=Acorus calamus TaxID=4465 RepID=A0AAV9DIW9_ACOCL|nr:hypothetical protein QJS10_CPB13g01394 [Acorus calamus]